MFGIAGHVAMLDAGRILWQGLPQDISDCDDPAVQRFLAGEPEPDLDDRD